MTATLLAFLTDAYSVAVGYTTTAATTATTCFTYTATIDDLHYATGSLSAIDLPPINRYSVPALHG